METLSITELKARVPAEPGEFAVHAQAAGVVRKEARNGNPYYELELADAGGSVKLKAWGDSAAFPQVEALEGGEFVCATGQWSHGDYGLDARDWTLRPLKDEETAEVVAGPGDLREKQAADDAYLQSITGGLADPRLRALCGLFFDKFGDRFRRSAGARKNHHARRGGLVEHTAQMMRTADAIAGVYPHLNRDLLLSGVLFHDIGKLWENCYPEKGFTMPYDFRAELMGHISIGVEIVNALWREMMEGEAAADWAELKPSGEHVKLHLLHLVLSHHGQLDYGSPVLPKTPEASALHYIDNLDAKMEMFAEGYESKAALSPQVFDRVWAIGANLVRPLPELEPDDETGGPPPPFDGLGESLPD